MQKFLLSTVSVVALASITSATEVPEATRPLPIIPVADWSKDYVHIRSASAETIASSNSNVAGSIARTPRAEAFLISDAITQAVLTNPGVGEASANRRATETELYQTQGAYLPQVRMESRLGPEKFRQSVVPPPLDNGKWLNGNEVSVVVRQILFNGFASIHEIWRQSARVDAAAFRVRERTELTALDAAEAYIDVVRFLRLFSLANQNVANHEELLANVRSRFAGGRTGEGDLQQALERVEAAKAAREEFVRGLEDARSKYRKVIGLEAINLRFPGPLPGLPRVKNDALTTALRHNATLLAAESDKEAAKQAFHATTGAFVPSVSLEGRAAHGVDSDTFIGKRDDVSGKVVVSWDIFRGGQDAWQRVETAERYTEETMRHARLQRDALESIDKAWAARTITANRIAALTRQLAAERKTIAIYRNEYEIGRRSLIDLLNAQNQYFDAAVSLTSARGVMVFADYQLLAAMGALLDYLRAPQPIESAPLDSIALGILPAKLPPPIAGLPKFVPDPSAINGITEISGPATTFDQRWSNLSAPPKAAAEDRKPSAPLPGSNPSTAIAFAPPSDMQTGQINDAEVYDLLAPQPLRQQK